MRSTGNEKLLSVENSFTRLLGVFGVNFIVRAIGTAISEIALQQKIVANRASASFGWSSVYTLPDEVFYWSSEGRRGLSYGEARSTTGTNGRHQR